MNLAFLANSTYSKWHNCNEFEVYRLFQQTYEQAFGIELHEDPSGHSKILME